MKKSTFRLSSTAAAALLTAAALIVCTAAQAPQRSQETTGNSPQPRAYPAPTNLKALPREMTGQQVHELMEQWEAALGTRCDGCHTEERGNTALEGRPRLNFADDSKPMKEVARIMYIMTEEINKSYLARIDSSGAPLTCGTCHRGRVGPEPFVAPSEDRPRAPQGPPPA